MRSCTVRSRQGKDLLMTCVRKVEDHIVLDSTYRIASFVKSVDHWLTPRTARILGKALIQMADEIARESS